MNQSEIAVLPRFRSDLCAGRRLELESRSVSIDRALQG